MHLSYRTALGCAPETSAQHIPPSQHYVRIEAEHAVQWIELHWESSETGLGWSIGFGSVIGEVPTWKKLATGCIPVLLRAKSANRTAGDAVRTLDWTADYRVSRRQ